MKAEAEAESNGMNVNNTDPPDLTVICNTIPAHTLLSGQTVSGSLRLQVPWQRPHALGGQ